MKIEQLPISAQATTLKTISSQRQKKKYWGEGLSCMMLSGMIK